MSGTNPIYYWDACIYLAWLKGEEVHGKSHTAAIAKIAADNADRKNVIITSTITLIEVLASSLTKEQEEQFKRSFRSPHHILHDVDPAIAYRAREFRDNIQKSKTPEDQRGLATPDAIHLATASIYEADEFHTFDTGTKERKKSYGLLELNRDVRIGKLVICKPVVQQPDLLVVPKSEAPPPQAQP